MILRIQEIKANKIYITISYYYNLLFFIYLLISVIPDPLWVVSLGLFDPELCDLSAVVQRL